MGNKPLSDQEKSVALARAMDWQIGRYFNGSHCFRPPENAPYGSYQHDLYAPENMAWAWRVLNWAYNGLALHTWGARSEFDYALARQKLARIFELYPQSISGFGLTYRVVYELPPADAQRLWLDKILELAVESGMVQEATP